MLKQIGAYEPPHVARALHVPDALAQKERKRSSNTPVQGIRFGLKFPDERRTKGVSTQTTYTHGCSGVGGGIHKQRYAAERVLPQLAVELVIFSHC